MGATSCTECVEAAVDPGEHRRVRPSAYRDPAAAAGSVRARTVRLNRKKSEKAPRRHSHVVEAYPKKIERQDGWPSRTGRREGRRRIETAGTSIARRPRRGFEPASRRTPRARRELAVKGFAALAAVAAFNSTNIKCTVNFIQLTLIKKPGRLKILVVKISQFYKLHFLKQVFLKWLMWIIG